MSTLELQQAVVILLLRPSGTAEAYSGLKLAQHQQQHCHLSTRQCIAVYCKHGEAVALVCRPTPFLGISSLTQA